MRRRGTVFDGCSVNVKNREGGRFFRTVLFSFLFPPVKSFAFYFFSRYHYTQSGSFFFFSFLFPLFLDNHLTHRRYCVSAATRNENDRQISLLILLHTDVKLGGGGELFFEAARRISNRPLRFLKRRKSFRFFFQS